jgi:hypothetical protein
LEFGVHFVSTFRQCFPIRFMVRIEDAKFVTYRSEKERGSNYLFLVLRSFQFACGSLSTLPNLRHSCHGRARAREGAGREGVHRRGLLEAGIAGDRVGGY